MKNKRIKVKYSDYEKIIYLDNNIYKLIVQIKNVNRVRLRVKRNEIYISSYRKLTDQEIDMIVDYNKDALIKYLKKYELSKPNENEVYILGKLYNKNNINLNQVKVETLEDIANRFERIRRFHNFPETELYLKPMRSRWGVCYPSKHRIGLSTNLIMASPEAIEYVIYHELCHYKYPNHSDKFYKLLSQYVPNYKEYRKELKKYSAYL